WDPAEVADTRQRRSDQPVDEFVHPVSAECHHDTDRHPGAKPERGDRLLRASDDRLLSADQGQVVDRRVQSPAIADRLAEPNIEDNLVELRNFMYVPVAEVLNLLRNDLFLVTLSYPCNHVAISSFRPARPTLAAAGSRSHTSCSIEPCHPTIQTGSQPASACCRTGRPASPWRHGMVLPFR